MELQTNISNCVFDLFSWISGRHLNAAWTKVNSCPSNHDSLLGFPISMKCACSYLKHQEPLLTAVFFSFLYLIITMPCQCHFRHFSYFMTSLHLHYHHCTWHMGISYLDSPMITFQVVYLCIPAIVIFLKKKQRWSYCLPLCVWNHSVTFSCTRKKARFLAWLRGGPKALHGLILLHFPPWPLYSFLLTSSIPQKCFLITLVLCIYCFFIF